MYIEKIFHKYRSLHDPAKASLWFVFCKIMQKMMSVITIPIITRMLTTEEYGVYSVFISYSSIFLIFGTLCLDDGGYYVGMKRYGDDKERYTSSVAGLTILLITVFFAFFLTCHNWIAEVTGMETYIVIMLFAWMYGQGIINLWFAENRYVFRYKAIFICTVFIAVATLILKIVFIYIFDMTDMDKSAGVILGFVIPVVIIGLIAGVMVFAKGKKFFHLEYWKFALLFNIPLIPYQLSQTLLMQVDRIMIEQLDSASAAGIYSVAYSLATVVMIVNTSINNSFTPWQFQMMKDGKHRQVADMINLILLPVLIIHFLLIFLAPELMRLFAASEYYDAIYIIPPVTISTLLMWVTKNFINVEFYYEKNKLLPISSILAALTNVTLNYILIPIFGYLAAGYTTLICYLIHMMVHALIAKRILKNANVESSFDLRKIIAIITSSLVVMMGMNVFYSNGTIRYVILVLILMVIIVKKREVYDKIKDAWRTVKVQ